MRHKVIAFLALLILAACGRGAYQRNTNYCSKKFVTDYNAWARVNSSFLNRVKSHQDYKIIRDNAREFKNKYAGVVCEVVEGTVNVNNEADVLIKACNRVIGE